MFKSFVGLVLALCMGAAWAAVDVNKASQADLETVKGIGPGLSGKILAERKKGEFKDWGDLVERVGGVGAGNAARFSSAGLTVNGAGYASAKQAPVDARKAKAPKGDTPAATSPTAAAADKSDKKSAERKQP